MTSPSIGGAEIEILVELRLLARRTSKVVPGCPSRFGKVGKLLFIINGSRSSIPWSRIPSQGLVCQNHWRKFNSSQRRARQPTALLWMCVNALFPGLAWLLTMCIDNDFSLFERPQHYIRYIGALSPVPCALDSNVLVEPLESELAVQVEYDMDEQGAH